MSNQKKTENKPVDKPEDKQDNKTDDKPETAVAETAAGRVEAGDQAPAETGASGPEDARKDKSGVKAPDTKAVAESKAKQEPPAKPPKARKPSRGFPFFGLFNLILIICIIAAAAYYWYLQQQAERQNAQTISAIQSQLGGKADIVELSQRLSPLESGISDSTRQIAQMQEQQQALLESTEELYELYGRDENDWKLAEIEYLMRVAQHKLILENDFEGAAITLKAASDKIAATADPGLLPVRVQISDEIAILKTRSRPDLVGMTLLISQLGKQLHSLSPGFKPEVEASVDSAPAPVVDPADQSMLEQIRSFMSKLVTVKKSDSLPTRTEATIIDIDEVLEDNLKLTRWTVLERDQFQYKQLMEENLRLFEQYYDLENAANHDFYNQLLELQKSEVNPQKPDISKSLEMLKQIMARREELSDAAIIREAGDV